MANPEDNSLFAQITAGLEEDREERLAFERDTAWQVEPRPVPEGLVRNGIPLGHIAFMGDFDRPNNS